MSTEYNLVTDADKFEINGSFLVTTQDGLPAIRFAVGGGSWDDTVSHNFPIEFVVNFTDTGTLELRGHFYSNAYLSTDGGAYETITQDGATGLHTFKTGMSAGKHLFRVFAADGFWNGFKITNGTIVSVATTKYLGEGAAPANRTISGTSPVKVWGARAVVTAEGEVPRPGFVGQLIEYQFSGTDTDFATVGFNGSGYAVKIDGTQLAQLVLQGDASNNNAASLIRANGPSLTPGTHTISVTVEGSPQALKGVRVLNGSRLASASLASALTITVDDGTKFSNGDWVRIGNYSQQEIRQVTVSGNVLTVSALTYAHAQYSPVTGWHHAAGTITAWTEVNRTIRAAFIGDSNTQGANPYGYGGVPDSGGIYYANFDTRISYAGVLSELLEAEQVNMGAAGTEAGQWSNILEPNPYWHINLLDDYAGSGYDYVFIWPDTNAVNSSTPPYDSSPTEEETYIRALVEAAIPLLKVDGKVILFGSKTPSGVTNPNGLNAATLKAKLALIAADPTYGGQVLELTDEAWADVNLSEYNSGSNPTGELQGVHLMPSAHTKIATNLAAAIALSGPTLSSPSVTNIDTDSADLAVTTDTNNGVAHYAVFAAGATPPITDEQVSLGRDGDDNTTSVQWGGVTVTADGVVDLGSLSGLDPNTEYDVYFGQITELDATSEVITTSFTTDPDPEAVVPTEFGPTEPKHFSVDYVTTKAILRWKRNYNDGTTAYRVYQDDVLLDPVEGISSETVTITGLTNGTTYTFEISAYNATDELESDRTPPIRVKPRTQAAAVTTLVRPTS